MQDQVHIVLDSVSAADETPLKKDPRCHVLRLILRHGDLEWRDGDCPLADMFKMVDQSGKTPTTSQPPLGEMIELFTRLTDAGKKLIVLNMDSVLSGTYQTACAAARQVMDVNKNAAICVIDSKTAATPIAGIATVVLAALDAGLDFEGAVQLTRDLVERTETFFSINTLDYLYKGGRIGAIGVLVGSILGIRPIARINKDGQLAVVEKCRTRKKVLKRMVELAADVGPLEAIYIANAEAPEDAEIIRRGICALYPEVPVMLSSIGAVLAAHLGPGAIGIFVTRRA